MMTAARHKAPVHNRAPASVGPKIAHQPRPVPEFAARVWHTGSDLVLVLDSGMQISIPLDRLVVQLTDGGSVRADQRGLDQLLRVLRDSANAARRPRLAEHGAPTQFQLEEALRGARKYAVNGQRKIDEGDLWGASDDAN